ncbi:MAG: hypothetical protein IT258_04355 [Saprospiraceae bacterium]|nr:hypothetical protein [Saprospiraceae bacterium]
MKKLIFLFAIAALPVLVQAQKLEGLRGALENGSSGGNGNGSGDGGGRGGSRDLFWADFFFNIALRPTWWLLFRGPNEMPPNAVGYNDYPYADDENGLYLPLDMDNEKRMALQINGHFQSDEDAVFGGYFQTKWSPNRALSLEVNHLQLFETLDAPNSADETTDHFSITNFSFGYNRVHHSRFQLWWGGGLMLLNPGKESLLYGSPTLNMGLTWYIKRPLSLYADGQIGFPNGVYARQHQARVQVHLKRYMIYAGYQGTKVGDVSIPSAALGAGVWF